MAKNWQCMCTALSQRSAATITSPWRPRWFVRDESPSVWLWNPETSPWLPVTWMHDPSCRLPRNFSIAHVTGKFRGSRRNGIWAYRGGFTGRRTWRPPSFFVWVLWHDNTSDAGLPWIWISMDKSMDISMDIMLAHLLIKLTTLYVLSLTLWLLPVLFLNETWKTLYKSALVQWLFHFCKFLYS